MIDSYIEKKNQKLMICNKRYDITLIKNLLENIEEYFEDAGTIILKAGDTTTVACVIVNNQFFVVKRYNILNFFHACKRAFRTSRAYKCWHAAIELLSHGIATPHPIAMLEERYFGLRGVSYFITEYVQADNALDYFKFQKSINEENSDIASKILALLNGFFINKISHGDLKATNILIKQNTPFIIDLDAYKKHRYLWTFKRAYRKDIQRFMKNWKDMPVVQGIFLSLSREMM